MSQYIETITFDLGRVDKRSPILLQDGELVTAQGMSYETPGIVEPRTSKQKISSTAVGSINGLHRNINYVLLADAANVRYKWDLDGYCDRYTPVSEDFTAAGTLISSNRPIFCDYEEFTFILTGNDKKVFVCGNLYDWDINAPAAAPAGTAGASGNPNGDYLLYYTYLVYFPNGTAVETAPSPAGSVTVSSQKIEWKNIGICPYAGSNLTIYRKLYRYSTTLIENYYVTTIYDNTTTTYSDNNSDATLELNAAISTSSYVTPPDDPSYACFYLQRLFVTAANYLYPSEAYYPFNFKNTSALQITQLGDDLVACVPWGNQLFIASTSQWYRLQGTDADSWQIKTTFATNGIINKHTIKATKYGIIGLWHDGIYLFDGNTTKNITASKIAKSVFDSISSKSSCYSEWDGRKYYFHYPTSGTTISKRLVLDFTSYPEIICYDEDFIPTAHHYNAITNINYYGYAGYHYGEGGTDTVGLSIKTGDRIAKNAVQQKQLEYLFYDIYTNNKDVVVSIYVDDTIAYTKTLNNTARTKERLLLPRIQGYRFYLTITVADARGIVIYEPWAISVNLTGQ